MATDTITAPQIRFLTSLLVERGLSTDNVLGLDKRAASKEIDRVKRLPRTAPAAAAPAITARIVDPLEGIPTDAATGVKYMINDSQGKPIQVEIKAKARGKYAGRTFMNLLVGAPGDWDRRWVSSTNVALWADKIKNATYTDPISGDHLTGPRAAAVRFSREHKCCAACMSPLSDTTQPGYVQGLGPVCVKKFL